MSTTTATTTTPANTNRLGLSRGDYAGGKSTLCTGCGHDSISQHVISAFFQSGINPFDVAKMSGIGCSSKTPAYWLSKAAGINSIHGRMAPCATGAKVANRKLVTIGVSGDGDTASIGIGGFIHLMRRNLPIAYLVANNGVYGLTKGQFSATADFGAKQKSGSINPFATIDLCSLAIDLGCTFVARSFSGDPKQLVPLISAALKHNGTAFIDIISPCVTFANHDGSGKSYNEVKAHNIVLQELGFVHAFEEKTVDYAEGTTETVEMADGSLLTLRKLDSRAHDIHDASATLKLLHDSREKGEILTGLLHVGRQQASLLETLNLCDKPLTELTEADTRPSREALQTILAAYR